MITIIIPVFNEENNLLEFNMRLISTLEKIDEQWEVIYIDDGSIDNSYNKLLSIAKEYPVVRALRFNKNYGQTFAFRAGLDYSKGNIIVFIDSDLQNDPADISLLLKKLKQGYDMVSGWRSKRKDNLITRIIPSIVANKLISFITGIKLHDIGCSLKAYRKSILQDIDFYGEMHRIIPIYAYNNGAKITEIQVNHHYRKTGKSKYRINRVFKLFLDVVLAYFICKYSTKPMYFFGGIGIFFLSFSIGILFFIILRVILLGGIWVSPLLFIAILLLLAGFQVILMGLLAEILIRLYYKRGVGQPYKVIRRIEDGIEITEA